MLCIICSGGSYLKSAPHIILFCRFFTNELFLQRISRNLYDAFFIVSTVSSGQLALLPSIATRKFLLRLSTFISMLVLSLSTMGRAPKLCEAIGVRTSTAASGHIMGPPTLKDYPVEPDGVATISPSAW